MARVVVGISVQTAVATFPVADPAGCREVAFGSGSGSCCDNGQDCPASECTQLSPACPDGMSTQFTFPDPNSLGNTVTLNWVCNPSDGNYSRFLSNGGEWSFTYEGVAYGGWVLKNLITGDIWVWSDVSGPICALAGFAMFPGNQFQDGQDEIDMTPTYDCGVSSYNCTAGNCVGVSGAGGLYADIEQCNAHCNISYNCVAGECVEVTDGTGTYKGPNAFLACQAACSGGGDGPSCVCCGDGVTAPALLHLAGCGLECGPVEVARSTFFGGFADSITCSGRNGTVVLHCNPPGSTATWTIALTLDTGTGGSTLTQNGNTLTGTVSIDLGAGPCDVDVVAILPDGCWEACP